MAKNKDVRPITNPKILNEFLNRLKNDTTGGIRNYTVFQTGKATLLRVSDVMKLKKEDVYDDHGNVKKIALTTDKKTKKPNKLYLRPIRQELINYRNWLQNYQADTGELVFQSKWLFPSLRRPANHLDGHSFYKIVHKVGLSMGIDWIGSHTMRKTGALMVYNQSGKNIGLVMKLLNHSSEAITLHYLGLEQKKREQILDTIDFNSFRNGNATIAPKAQATDSANTSTSSFDQKAKIIKEYKNLLDNHAIDQKEYDSVKRKILGV